MTLTVEDTAGQTDSASESVTVRDDPPVASFTYTCNGLTCTFDASGSTDDVGIASYNWSFVEGPRSTTAETITHTFSSAGSWQVSLSVRGHRRTDRLHLPNHRRQLHVTWRATPRAPPSVKPEPVPPRIITPGTGRGPGPGGPRQPRSVNTGRVAKPEERQFRPRCDG